MTAPVGSPRRGPAPPPADIERRALLDAGLALLTEHGTASLTLSAILDRAELSTRAFYRHFTSKDEFVIAVWLRDTEAAARRMRRITDRAPTGRDAVVAWIDDWLNKVFVGRLNPAFKTLWRHGSWLRNTYPAEFTAVLRPQIDVLASAITRGVADGSISTADADLDASTIHATFWMLAGRHVDGKGLTRKDAHRQLDRVLAGLFPPVAT